MTGDEPDPNRTDHGAAAGIPSQPRVEAGSALGAETADEAAPGSGVEAAPASEVESTMALPPVRHRWRRELREDIDPEVHAAFYYLRGLIAGDGRPHKAIAEAMAISPAEFTKRFSLTRETFPPWAGIAPLFGVLDRDPTPFWARWGRLWAAPWASDTLTYYGEPERFPTLTAHPTAAAEGSGPAPTVSNSTDGARPTTDDGTSDRQVAEATSGPVPEPTDPDSSPRADTLSDGEAETAEEPTTAHPNAPDDSEGAALGETPEISSTGPAVVEMGLETSGTLRLADLHAHRPSETGDKQAREVGPRTDPPWTPRTPAPPRLPPGESGVGPWSVNQPWPAPDESSHVRPSAPITPGTSHGPQLPPLSEGSDSGDGKRSRQTSRRALAAAVIAALLAGGIGIVGTWAVTRAPAAEAGPVTLLGAATAPADAPPGNASLRQAPDLAAPVVVPAGSVGTLSAACTVPAAKLAEDATPGSTTTWLRTTDGAFLPSVYFRAANATNSLQSCERPDVQLPFGMFHPVVASSVAPTSTPAFEAAATTTRPRRTTTTTRTTQERVTTPPTTTTDSSPQPGDPNYHPCDDPKNYAECDYNMSKAAATPGWKPSSN